MTPRTEFTAAVDRIRSDLIRIRVVGEIDIATVDELKKALAEAADSATVIDLSECGFIDSTGLGALLQAARSADGEDGRMVVASPTPEIGKLLSLTAVDQLLPTLGSIDEAIAYLNDLDGE